MLIKGLLSFLILVTIIYVYTSQKSQNELIDNLKNDIEITKKSIDLKIKQKLNKVITQEIINKIKTDISNDLDNIVNKQFEISRKEFKNKLSKEQQDEIIRFTKEYTDQQIKKTFDEFQKLLKDKYYQNEGKVIKDIEDVKMRLIEFENKLNKTIDEISITLNAKLTKYKTDNIDVIESKIIDSIKYLKNMNARIIANQESIKELSLMLESHVGVDPVNLLDFDVKEALSINVNGEEDNAGGPSYLIFDNQKMSKKDAIVTFTAKYDIKVYGIFIGMGGNGGRGYLRGQDHNHPVAYGGNGSGGQDGVRYTFNLKKGEKILCSISVKRIFYFKNT